MGHCHGVAVPKNDELTGASATSTRRRRFRRVGAGLLVLLVGAAGTAYAAQDRIIDAAIKRQLTSEPDSSFATASQGDVRVMLCGTGTPEISAARSQACTLVAAGGKMFLFDAGEGATRSLSQEGVDVAAIEQIFITHFHSDHFNGLPTMANEAWIWGRTEPFRVTGPAGITDVVAGFDAAYAKDADHRASHMAHLAETREASRMTPVEIAFADGERSTRVYEADGVAIDAVLVEHEPVAPAVGYVITYGDQKVFVSGDTTIDPGNLEWMQDADLVIHEAYATHLIRRAIPIMRELGNDHEAQVTEKTIDYHADTIALAEQAQEAGVRHLVLTHLTPYPNNAFARHLFVDGMSEEYDGHLTLGRDGMVLTAGD